MYKVYWILALALLIGTGWNYTIRITTIDYLNRYQNSQQSQFNDQGSSTSNHNSNNQNSNNQNSNSQSQSTPGGQSSLTNGSNLDNTSAGNITDTGGYASWNPNEANYTYSNTTNETTVNSSNATKEEPVMYVSWVERAGQNQQTNKNSNMPGPKIQQDTDNSANDNTQQSNQYYSYNPNNAHLYDNQQQDTTTNTQGQTIQQTPSPTQTLNTTENEPYVYPDSTLPSFPFIPSNNPYAPATYYTTQDTEALQADFQNMAGGIQTISDPNANLDWSNPYSLF